MRRAILILPLLGGCLEPFPEKTTTPSRSGSASKPARPAAAKKERRGAKEKKGQSYKQAWKLICQAEKLGKIDRSRSREERGSAVAEWIVANVKNKRARYWFIGFGKLKPADREAFFRDEVRRVGMKSCPLTELLFAKPASRPARDAAP